MAAAAAAAPAASYLVNPSAQTCSLCGKLFGTMMLEGSLVLLHALLHRVQQLIRHLTIHTV